MSNIKSIKTDKDNVVVITTSKDEKITYKKIDVPDMSQLTKEQKEITLQNVLTTKSQNKEIDIKIHVISTNPLKYKVASFHKGKAPTGEWWRSDWAKQPKKVLGDI